MRWSHLFFSAGLLVSNGTSLVSDVTNPWSLSVEERIVNRKSVSHIVLETRPGGFRLTLLINERFPYNYKSKSSQFFIRVRDAKEGLELAEKLDKYLESGYNILLRMNGSEIVEYVLDESIR
ncbi:hypothetical protein EHQ27_18440 [Leptospira wolffii]|uniref:Uncharacterized protein n=1 Tax=Leptospira wolffii TaxID=409998 RepID=A0A2M9Z7V3_9LEPT|nr:hypothetical protein [Leptospira wolffii]PJZ64503.1 hypothetical protein CH371_17150 [Leptospira wolffii]TGK55280.1 hypothetical protein EHQ32_18665 [Leptospira wolffii]TGK65781.1 hypothetical protein EHQ27_18440 [Leptospira wolffii]TGK70589.1 hypothetical protein EHQ35_15845 [Leptospira wolffii]TGL30044.1 hypothetical protein EHQ57_09795 [Leptospira wolffii]